MTVNGGDQGRVFHHYEMWEEYQNGMWRSVSKEEEDKYFKEAVEFTGQADKYGHYMIEVIHKWPISCEQNLTNMSINRRAWIGHAACCLAFGCPEHIVRKAWWKLTDQQRKEANQQADMAITEWEEMQRA